MKRTIDLAEGRAFVVTDLHGEWEPYTRYRDEFLDLRARGEADLLIFLGDVIHGYGPPEADSSLPILWDIMDLQRELGSDSVIVLLGNHELPHIYGVTLSKGDNTFTPRFEHALGEYRDAIIDFLCSLPFLIRTSSGVMLTHAGASAGTALPDAAARLVEFSHADLLAEVDLMLAREDVLSLVSTSLGVTREQYDAMSWEYLAVRGKDDPRYPDLLRGFIASSLEPEWSILWEFFFTQCEASSRALGYERILERFLASYSDTSCPQRVLVTGHIPVQGGCQIVARRQLRLASWTHAFPHEAGCYLLFDVAQPVTSASDLLPFVHSIP